MRPPSSLYMEAAHEKAFLKTLSDKTLARSGFLRYDNVVW